MRNLKEIVRLGIVFVLTLEARLVLKKYRPKIIAVTGSVGKTSAKDAVYTALSNSFFVRRSEKSFNSDIGVPLTVLGVRNGWSNIFQWARNLIDGVSLVLLNTPYPKWLVVEIGADRPGDITRSLRWLKPDVVVATRFPDISVHVEFYDSPEKVIEEELAPVGWLETGGVFVFNEDDERAKSKATAPGVTRVSFGFGSDATLRCSNFSVMSENGMPTGIAIEVTYKNEKVAIELPSVAGRSHVYSVLAGLAVAVGVGISLADAVATFQKHEAPIGRMRLIPGIKGSMIIDDTYNSSPAATEEALATLSDIPRTGRRIAVLADMLELGAFSVREHHRIGTLVPHSADVLVTVGVRTKGLAEAAHEAGMEEGAIIPCERSSDATTAIISLLQPGDVILVKGSQSMRMERVVKSLMAKPEHAKDLLVRQDAEWISRA
ncbi:MAG: UDP-N-acetylmuramoyl-tripeptide--D-alanyl-D-alanine ligase [Patescibacteria group bacterium]